jgi:hypothetical protein
MRLYTESGSLKGIITGSVVSLTSSGTARVGGGTSIYTDVTSLSASCPQFLDIEPAFDDIFVMSYVNGVNHDSTIAAMVLSAANKGTIVSKATHSGEIYEIVTISQNRGVFVAITQDSVAGGGSAAVFAGKVGLDGKTVAFGTDVVYCTDEYSLNPSITVLSETEFALSYYCTEGGRQVVSTRAG